MTARRTKGSPHAVEDFTEETVEISARDMYSPDLDSFILKRLHDKYDRICLHGKFYEEVLKIVSRTHLIMDLNGGTAQCSVGFISRVRTYEPGDLVISDTVRYEDSVVLAQASGVSCNVTLPRDPSLRNALSKNDQRLPLIVQTSRYPICGPSVKVESIIMAPMVAPPVLYRIRPTPLVQVRRAQGVLAQTVQSAIRALPSSLDTKMVQLARFYMFPFAGKPSASAKRRGKIAMTAVTLKDYEKLVSGFVFQPPDAPDLKTEFMHANEDVVKDEDPIEKLNLAHYVGIMVIDIDPYSLFMLLARRAEQHRNNIEVFAGTYTTAMLTSHKRIFGAINRGKMANPYM